MSEEAPPSASAPVDSGEAAGGPTPGAALQPEEPGTHPPAAVGGPYREGPPAPAMDGPPWRPNYVFLTAVSILSLAADLGTKAWAKGRLADAPFSARSIELVQDHVALRFAENKGGAWGLLQGEPESIRRPFFLGISAIAVVFIVSLYRKLTPQQTALKWGLPLVLGGALGNLVNRIQYNYVVDFIDVRAGFIRWLNGLISPGNPTDHWPTFNIADVAIVVGVILMAVDMFTPRKVDNKLPVAGVDLPVAAPAPAPADGAAAPKET